MLTRKEAVEFWTAAFDNKLSEWEDKRPWHVGRVEVRLFLDKLYGGPPTCKEEEL
jgi:hypothetical protein